MVDKGRKMSNQYKESVTIIKEIPPDKKEIKLNPAEEVAKKAHRKIIKCVDEGRSFLVEAGAGSGKTYSLIETLKYLIQKHESELIKRNQQIACITYTNAAVKEIETRIDKNPVIIPSTIHSFCWSIIGGFQSYLKEELIKMDNWQEKFKEAGISEIGMRKVNYKDPASRKIYEDNLTLWHDDVLELLVCLMKKEKFWVILKNKYPIILIDEYQDCNKKIADSLKLKIEQGINCPLVGFFGDSWQKIYSNVCGKIENEKLETVELKSNFRSAPIIVDFLNRMRLELQQEVSNPNAEGTISVYHTNSWSGIRRTDRNWNGDLPDEVAHEALKILKELLKKEGWDFTIDKTKVLMLTHRILSKEQGYEELDQIFSNREQYVKKENPHIKFFAEILEPACKAYENRKYGEMFDIMGIRTLKITKYADKLSWVMDFNELIELRSKATVGVVLDYIRKTERPRLPEEVERRECELERFKETTTEEKPSYIENLQKLRNISYQNIIKSTDFIENNTPFSTKHNVKGTESENILVVLGRGWNMYNWNEYLEWVKNNVPNGKEAKYERNRNLFYVSCSRAKKRLALLFTQELSNTAIDTLNLWFNSENVYSLSL